MRVAGKLLRRFVTCVGNAGIVFSPWMDELVSNDTNAFSAQPPAAGVAIEVISYYFDLFDALTHDPRRHHQQLGLWRPKHG